MSKIKMMMVTFLMMTLFACGGSEPKIELKKETFVYEYGEQYSFDAKEYIKADKKVLKDTKIEIQNKNVKVCPKDAECDAFVLTDVYQVGKYKGTATYQDEKLEFIVEIKDTTKPTFEDFQDKVEVAKYFDGDLVTNFKATDLSEVVVTVDTKDVDFSTSGDYKAKAIATDKYKNKITKEFTIIVGEKTQVELDEEAAKKTEEEIINQQNENQNQVTEEYTGVNETNNTTTTNSNTNTSGETTTCSFTGWQMVSNSGYANYDYQTTWNWGEMNVSANQYYKVLSTKDNCGKSGWTVLFLNKE